METIKRLCIFSLGVGTGLFIAAFVIGSDSGLWAAAVVSLAMGALLALVPALTAPPR